MSEQEDWSMILMDGDRTVDALFDAMQMVVRNQQTLSHSLQGLLSEVTRKLGALEQRVDALQQQLSVMESSIVERDLRAQNRKIRMHDAFTFTAAKSTAREARGGWL